MEQSSTYRAIVRRGREEGRVEGARRLVLLLAQRKLGVPDAATFTALEAITDLEYLDLLGVRLMEARSWEELLATRRHMDLGIEQSALYQAIIGRGRDEGRLEGARRQLLNLGQLKFGPLHPMDPAIHAALEAITEQAQLEALAVRMMNVGSWQELLAAPAPPRRNGRRKTGS